MNADLRGSAFIRGLTRTKNWNLQFHGPTKLGPSRIRVLADNLAVSLRITQTLVNSETLYEAYPSNRKPR